MQPLLNLLRRIARHPRVRWVLVRTPPITGIIATGPARGLRFRAPRGHLFYLTGGSEPLVQEVLARELRPGDVVFDIGAFVGFETVVSSRLVGPSGRVIAFEPNPYSATELERNAARNGFTNVTVMRAAVGATAARGAVIGHGGSASLAAGDEVDVVALDMLDLPRPKLIKVDIEGAETEALRGMSRTLLEHKPVVVVEIHGETGRDCEAFLCDHGYSTEWLRDGGMPHLVGHPTGDQAAV